jgi:hypothetical protein
MMLAVGFSHVAFPMLRYDMSILGFFGTFITKGC